MYTLFALAAAAFLLCLVLTPLCRTLAHRFDLVDHPDHRKLHKKPTPRLGGIPIVLSYALAVALVWAFPPAHEHLYIQHKQLLWSLLPAAGIIFLTGLLDDLIGLRPRQKLLGQAAGSALAVGMGTHIALAQLPMAAAHPILMSPWVTAPVSFLWLMTCTNAVNLIDGLDGLASGVGLFATVTMLLAAVFSGNAGLKLATVPLVGCLLAFLCYNFNPASIFLGDSGSLTIGFMLGCFSLIWSRHSGTLLGIAAPLVALALPLMDVGLAISRRYLKGKPIFQPDRGHIHHMVLARGFKPRQTALILYGVCAISASLALLQGFSHAYMGVLSAVMFVALVWAGVNYLGYAEFGALSRVLSRQWLLRIIRDEIALHDLEKSVEQATTVDDFWQILLKLAKDMHCGKVELHYGNTYLQHILAPGDLHPPFSMSMPVPIGKLGHLVFVRDVQQSSPRLMAAMLERLTLALSQKEFPCPGKITKWPGAA